MKSLRFASSLLVLCLSSAAILWSTPHRSHSNDQAASPLTIAAIVHQPLKHDVSPPLASLRNLTDSSESASCAEADCGTAPDDPDVQQAPTNAEAAPAPAPPIPPAAVAIEQTTQGKRPAVPMIESFDGLGSGFQGPQGTAQFRNPSDNSLAVGPNHIVQIVNSRFAVYTKKGSQYDTTGKVLYGPVPTNDVFQGFGGPCEARNNGDAVVRYDQLAGRWLVVMPIFWPIPPEDLAKRVEPAAGAPVPAGQLAKSGQAASAGAATPLPANPAPPKQYPRPPFRLRPGGKPGEAVDTPKGTFGMCYAVSTTSDPLGPYYHYAFQRELFPDYPRPAVWPDGYYVPTSTGDTVIQKHACVADRNKMLAGQPATEQCVIIDGVNFLNNADVDGQTLPPPGAPNIMMANGGTQLKDVFEDNVILAWKFHVDWKDPSRTKAEGPMKIPVAPYHYLCNGQLTHCVPQPGTDVRLDVQGDKLMQRLVYRRIGKQESILATHSIYAQGGGGVRWYEFRLDKKRDPYLYQQGTYAADGFYRFIPSIGMDKKGNIGVGYSFGGSPNFAGQRFVAREAKDPKGVMSLRETVLAEGGAAQTSGFRWEDYTTTAMDPSDDCTFWYVGDYLKNGEKEYRSRIGAFKLPTCR